MFPDPPAAGALAELAGEGPTADWARAVAHRLRCAVVLGFIRRDKEDSSLFNSQAVFQPSGELVAVYDKHFLYAADETWAKQGSGFATLRCDWLGGLKVGLGICMDINPCKFEAAWDEFEFASFHKREGSQVILFSSAWCNRHPNDPEPSPVNGPDTINYWAARLRPLIGSHVYFVAANRVGCEPVTLVSPSGKGDVTFVGSSCVIDLQRPSLVRCLNTVHPAVLVCALPLQRPPTAPS
mmetsp:Transcript_4994/g.12783  ORF Transcript_4994/g.12783 Transcript_4994/m.12783 type:complete len:239 (+) Transcript_4994:312-1028(+)